MLAEQSMAVSVRGLHKKYGQKHAVKGVNLDVPPSQVFTLLGPNGAGKTTTLEMLEGLRNPDAGSINYFGSGESASSRSVRARIGVQLQSSAFYPHLSVLVLLETFAALYPRSRPIDELLQRFDLSAVRGLATGSLSGGQLQRVALACALVNDPELVFLDEPSTGLDPQSRLALWKSIRDLAAEGRTVVLTTHDMDEAESLASQVVIMDHGEIIAEGTCAELAERYRQKNLEGVFLALTGHSLRN